nr:hypothetical protein [Tanacetum cinerariifolium]
MVPVVSPVQSTVLKIGGNGHGSGHLVRVWSQRMNGRYVSLLVIEDQTGWKLRRRKWTDTTERVIDDLESAYGRMYVEGHVNIFAMVDIDLFTVVALNMMTLTPPRFRATIEEITDGPGSIALIEHRSEKMLLLTWHDSNELNKEPICDFITSRSLPQCDSSTPYGEAGFVDVARSDVGRTQEHIMVEVRTQEPIVEEIRTQDPIMEEVIVKDYVSSGEDVEQGNGQEDVSASSDEHFFYDDEGIDSAYETQYDVWSSEDAVPDDVLEGKDVDVINPDGFDSPGVMNASGQWKYSFYTRKKFTTAKEAKDKVYLHSFKSRRKLKLYKNDSVKVKARCDGKVLVFTMSQELKLKLKKKIRGDHVLQYSMLRDYVVELQYTNLNTTVKIAIEGNNDPSLPTRVFQRALKLDFRAFKRELLGLDGAFMKGPFLCQCLGDDIDLHPNSNYTFIGDRQKFKGSLCNVGGNNAEASGSASRQAQQAKPAVGQDGSGGLGVSAVIGLSITDYAGGAGVGVGSQGSSHTRWKKRRVKTVIISP